MAVLQGEQSDTTVVVTTECGVWECANDPGKMNTQAWMLFLRSWQHPDTGTPLFTYQHIADALGYKDRRDVKNYWRAFAACGNQLLSFLQRKRTVDASVVEAVTAEVRHDILAPAPA